VEGISFEMGALIKLQVLVFLAATLWRTHSGTGVSELFNDKIICQLPRQLG